jgi:hypothetical protein
MAMSLKVIQMIGDGENQHLEPTESIPF